MFWLSKIGSEKIEFYPQIVRFYLTKIHRLSVLSEIEQKKNGQSEGYDCYTYTTFKVLEIWKILNEKELEENKRVNKNTTWMIRFSKLWNNSMQLICHLIIFVNSLQLINNFVNYRNRK